MSTQDAMPVPNSAKTDAESRKMLRAWIADNGLHCSLRIGMYDEADGINVSEATAWGVLLSDVARHVGDTLFEKYKLDKSATLDAVRAAFVKELDKPTSPTTGNFAG